jgi:methylated-DNA-protein-cysteine methyltransferase-like protein
LRRNKAPLPCRGGAGGEVNYTMAITNEDAAALCARVYALVRACPVGRVTTYGAIGKALGHPRGARMIGWIMNETPDRLAIPAQRVISKDGTLSGGWAFGGAEAMRGLLEGEEVSFDERGRALMKVHEWDPTRDLPSDELAQLLADAPAAMTVEPSVQLLRLLNRDAASPFSQPTARM